MCPVLHARGRLEWQDDAPSSPKPRLPRIMATRLSCVPFTAVVVAEEAFVVMLFPRSFGSTLPALFLVKPGCHQRSAVRPPWRSDEKPNASFLGLRSCGRNRTGPMRPSTGQNPVDETGNALSILMSWLSCGRETHASATRYDHLLLPTRNG